MVNQTFSYARVLPKLQNFKIYSSKFVGDIMQENSNLKRLLIFGGQFDPVHIEHMHILQAAIAKLSPSIVKVIPSYGQKVKSTAIAPFTMRVKMLKIALAAYHIDAEVDEIESTLTDNGYTITLLKVLQERYPNYKIYFLMGADQFLNFDNWKEPEKIVQLATLIIANRHPFQMTEELILAFKKKYNTEILFCAYNGEGISSSVLQCKLAFGKSVANAIPNSVIEYIQENYAIYQPDILQKGLELLMPMRKEHSYRVTKMAMQAVNIYHLNRRQVLFAAALHDIAKNLQNTHPLLQNFKADDRLLTDKHPVWHAFAGAYLAEYYLGITDATVLNAIAYHTTGRAEMTILEKVIYLADMLEEERNFENIAYLKQFYPHNVDKCIAYALQYSIKHLKEKKWNIYYKTEEAWEYYKKYGDK